jgi:RNA polymerase sigma factor (sigma-70 family)
MLESKTDYEIITAISNGGLERDKAWEYIYKTWSKGVIKIIQGYGGNIDDAIDLMGEVAMPFEKTIRNPDFILTSAKLSTYFTKCVINSWYKKRNLLKTTYNIELEDRHQEAFVQSVDANMMKSDLALLIDQTLSVIGERCKKILTQFMNGYSMKEIAESMNFRGEQIAKNEKSKCQKSYELYLKSNPHIIKQILYLKND